MSGLQLRGFFLGVVLLAGISAGSAALNYWTLSQWHQESSPQQVVDLKGGSLAASTPEDGGKETVVSTVFVLPPGQHTTTGDELTVAGETGVKGQAPSPAPPASEKININTASAAQLETLPGVGPATARSIIDYRTRNGSFSSVEELSSVDGIGEKKLAKIRDHATT